MGIIWVNPDMMDIGLRPGNSVTHKIARGCIHAMNV
jgi:hypothetical protein